MEAGEIRFIDLFSGIGGFRLGLERANHESNAEPYKGEYKEEDSGRRRFLVSGSDKVETGYYYKCVWSCDWDFNEKGEKEGWYANRVYAKHFGWENHFSGDVRGINPETIPRHDVLCAGFPCQSFSTAGKRLGFQDPRGTLFYEILRIAEAKRPQLLLLENVRGLLSNDRGQTFKTILQELGRIGYWCEWQVLNSKHFGVPQSRPRVFIIGHLAETERSGREIFPVLEAQQHITRAPEATQGQDGSENLIADFNQDGNTYFKNDSASLRSPKASQSNLLVKGVIKLVGDRDNRALSLKTDESFTVGANEQSKAQKLIDGLRIRRLTPIECERLQGFPDDWTQTGLEPDPMENKKCRSRYVNVQKSYLKKGKMTKERFNELRSWTLNLPFPEMPINNGKRYEMLGNAVTTNVVTFLGKRIMDVLGVIG